MLTPSDDRPVTVRLICNEAEWDDIRADWNALYAESSTASTPLDFTWLRTWWRLYAPVHGDKGLRIVTMWRQSQLIGAAPLFVQREFFEPVATRVLRFISTGEAEFEETCPDYLNILCLPHEETVCADAFWAAVRDMRWDLLEFLDMPADSPLVTSEHDGLRPRVESRGVCPIADLNQGFDAYIAQRSANARERLRREMRKADQAGARLEVAGAGEVDSFFEDLVRLHQERWMATGQAGCFAAPRFTDFHRRLTREWVPQGRAVLARLAGEDTLYAVVYGFITGSKFELYQLGVKRGSTNPVHSPGIAANLLLMKQLAQRGVTQYDFLRGSSDYKRQLATSHNPLVSIRLRRPTLGAIVHESLRLAECAVDKGKQIVRQAIG